MSIPGEDYNDWHELRDSSCSLWLGSAGKREKAKPLGWYQASGSHKQIKWGGCGD